MISKNTLAIIVIALVHTLAEASVMTIEPEKPSYGDTLTITYFPDTRYADLAREAKEEGFGPYLVLQAYDGEPGQPKAYSVTLDSLDSISYRTKFVLAENEAFADLKVVFPSQPDHRDDINNGDFWQIIAYNEDGLPERNANYYQGLSLLGANPEKYKNLRMAMDSYAEEKKLYLNNYLNRIALKSLMLDTRKLSYDKFKSEMEALIKTSKPDLSNENTVRAYSRVYNIIGEADKAIALEKDFVLKNPRSPLAEEFLLEQLRKAQSKTAFTDISDQYLKAFGKSEKAAAVYAAINSVYVDNGDYSQLIRKLKSYDEIPSQVWVDVATAMVTDKNFMPQDSMSAKIDSAKSVLAMARGIQIEDQIVQVKLNKPRSMSSAEGMRYSEKMHSTLLISYGDFHYTIGEDETALEYYETSANYIGEESLPAPLWQQLVLTNKNLGDLDKAGEYAAKAIKHNADTDRVKDFYKEYLISKNPDAADFVDRKVDKLREEGFVDKVSEMAYFDIMHDSPSAIFSTLDGMYVDTDDWEGKTVVISFISSWCMPCEETVESLSALDSYYREDPDILFYAISSWEKEKDKKKAAATILEDKRFGFPLLVDETDIIPQKFDVTGMPTTIVIDKEGHTRFRYDGIVSDRIMVDNIRAALTFLEQNEITEDSTDEQ
jgi:tetratricopeptide (TPR) repeat protein